MPKKQEFNIKNYNDRDFRNLLSSELEAKAKKVTISGAKIKSQNFRIWDIEISNEDLEKFKNSKKASDLLLAKYKIDYNEKKIRYDRLKARCDFCLHDVKPYQKLIKNIEEFTYCGATTELEAFAKRYIYSNGYTKALYRARSQEFSKIKC